MKADECDGCGQPRSQSFDPDNAEAYTVDTITAGCAACYALAVKQDREPPGPLYRVRLREP